MRGPNIVGNALEQYRPRLSGLFPEDVVGRLLTNEQHPVLIGNYFQETRVAHLLEPPTKSEKDTGNDHLLNTVSSGSNIAPRQDPFLNQGEQVTYNSAYEGYQSSTEHEVAPTENIRQTTTDTDHDCSS